MPIYRGDRVKLRNTDSFDTSSMPGAFPTYTGGTVDRKFDGLIGTVLEGPFTEESTKDIPIYKVRLDKNQIGPDEVIVKVTWSALEFVSSANEKELFEAEEKWRKILNE